MAKAVTVIPPMVSRFHKYETNTVAKRRVAAYARVSTDTEEQLSSYEAQVDYYTRYIQEQEGWDFVEVYTDEGISATNTKKRDGFNRMIADALKGKIDIIITKSVSRFARNTVDTLTTVRKLKEKGVEVYFEKENIYTLDSKGELLITIMSSLAQEESRSISENVTWGQRKRFADGKVTMPYKRFLGYDRGEDGNPIINEEQAELVRQIYAMFINGMTPTIIAKQLTQQKVPTPGGRHVWQTKVIESILTNEKYKGDALLQKTFCTDYLTKKMKPNEGEIPQYYVEGSHPPIVSTELFDLVQAEMQRRKGVRYTASTGCFSGRIICGDCGSVYGSKVWHSTSKYRRTIWRCNRKYEKDGDKCSTPHFYEEQLKDIFLGFINSLITDRNSIISAYKDVISTLTDNKALEEEHRTLQSECEVVMELMRKMVQENARTTQDQSEYQQRYSAMVERFNKANGRLTEVEKMIEGRNAKRLELERVIKLLKKQDNLLAEFDEGLWQAIVYQMRVHSATEFTFILKDGTELPWGTGR